MDSRVGPDTKGTWRDAHNIQDTLLDRENMDTLPYGTDS